MTPGIRSVIFAFGLDTGSVYPWGDSVQQRLRTTALGQNQDTQMTGKCGCHPRSSTHLKGKLSEVSTMTVFIFFFFLVFSKILLKVLKLFQLYHMVHIKDKIFHLNLGQSVTHENVSSIPPSPASEPCSAGCDHSRAARRVCVLLIGSRLSPSRHFSSSDTTAVYSLYVTKHVHSLQAAYWGNIFRSAMFLCFQIQ